MTTPFPVSPLRNIANLGVSISGAAGPPVAISVAGGGQVFGYLQRIEAVCTAVSGGGPGAWDLSAGVGKIIRLQQPVAPVVGTRLSWEFPTPIPSSSPTAIFAIEKTANVGTWFFTVNGFYSSEKI